MKPELKESVRPRQRSNAPTPKGAINIPDDTSIVRQAWRAVKRFAALMGCVILALLAMMFIGAPIEGGMSWSAGFALAGTAGWLCRVCYKVADGETEEHL